MMRVVSCLMLLPSSAQKQRQTVTVLHMYPEEHKLPAVCISATITALEQTGFMSSATWLLAATSCSLFKLTDGQISSWMRMIALFTFFSRFASLGHANS
jgi:hypothetical protein